MSQEILTMAEAARFLRISKPHLSNIVHGKVLGVPPPPVVRVGRRVLFRRSSLEQWAQDVEQSA